MLTHARARFYGPYEDYGYRNFMGVRYDVLNRPGTIRVALGEYHAILSEIGFSAWENYVRTTIYKQAYPNEKRFYELLDREPSPIHKPTLVEFFQQNNPGEGCKLLRWDPLHLEYIEVGTKPKSIPATPWVHLTDMLPSYIFLGEVSHTPRTDTYIVRVSEYLIETSYEGLGSWEKYIADWYEANRGHRYVPLPNPEEWQAKLPAPIKAQTRVKMK